MLSKIILLLVISTSIGLYSQPGYGQDPIDPETPIFDDGFEGGLSGPLVSTITIGPQGGEFTLSNGIKLSVPVDAVTTETVFRFRLVPEDEITLPADIFKSHEAGYLGGFEATPYGYMFDKPISITIPGSGWVDPTNTPYPMFMNTDTNEFTPVNELDSITTSGKNLRGVSHSPAGNITAPPGYRFWLTKIKVSCEEGIVIPDLSALPLEKLMLAIAALDKLRRESDCARTPCRCCGFYTESEDFDSSSTNNNGCYSVFSKGFIKYLECEGQPTESWDLSESNLDVEMIPASARVKLGEPTGFTAVLTDENDDPVTEFSITDVVVKDPSVIETLGHNDSSVYFNSLDTGSSEVEITIAADGCEYKAWVTVEVVDDVALITNSTVTVTEGCTNTIQVKLASEPSSPVVVMINKTGGDPDIDIDSGSTLNFDELNWKIDQTVTLYAHWDEDIDNGSAGFEIIGSAPDDDFINVESTSFKAHEHDISQITLEIEGNASKFDPGKNKTEIHDSLSGTLTLEVEHGIASGSGELEYTGYGSGRLYITETEYVNCTYSIEGTGHIDFDGTATCIDNDCTLSLYFELYTDYMFNDSCSGATHNIDYYDDDEIINLVPLNDYVYDESADYYDSGTHIIERIRIQWLQPPGQ